MDDKLIYETANFKLQVPYKPHVSRKEGGHVYIKKKNMPPENVYDLSPRELIELMRFTVLAGESYKKAMNLRGIEIKRLNFQDNGNWAYLRGEVPVTHIHIYGRTEYSDKQKWGEALYFPNQFTDYYNEIEPINIDDIKEIKKQIELLEKTEKYKLTNWNL